MAKTNTPFLSLGSRGTIGAALTSQKRDDFTVLRSKPTPAYRRTLPQTYQRWLYEYYAWKWTQQTLVVKQSYTTQGYRFHLTGFQSWMKYNLTNLPDIALWAKLDEKGGATAYDSSRNALNGTILGATPTTGRIAGAYHFDGLNDIIDWGNPPLLSNFTQKSLVFSVKLTAFTGAWRGLHQGGYWAAPFGEFSRLEKNANTLTWFLKNTLAGAASHSFPFTPGTWYDFGYSWDGANVQWYLAGAPHGAPVAFAGTLSCTSRVFQFGVSAGYAFSEFDLDNLIISREALPSHFFELWAGRRYP